MRVFSGEEAEKCLKNREDQKGFPVSISEDDYKTLEKLGFNYVGISPRDSRVFFKYTLEDGDYISVDRFKDDGKDYGELSLNSKGNSLLCREVFKSFSEMLDYIRGE